MMTHRISSGKRGASMMMRLSLAVAALLILNPLSADAYYGRNATETWLSFNGQLDIVVGEDAEERVREQLEFLVGHFQSESYLEQTPFPGVTADVQMLK